MNIEDIYRLTDKVISPDASQINELKIITDKYPYFQQGIFLYLKGLYTADDDNFRQELQRLSVFVNDKKALFYYIMDKEYEQFFERKKNKKEIDENRTNMLLNAFFEATDSSTETNELIFSGTNVASVDYFSYLESTNKSNEQTEDVRLHNDDHIQLKHQNIIDDFIDNIETSEKIVFNLDNIEEDDTDYDNPEDDDEGEDLTEELRDDLFFTETLAKIYIKQHKYERAYEIIERLYLNYPEKNIYFANQISFLKKLIINSKIKNKNV